MNRVWIFSTLIVDEEVKNVESLAWKLKNIFSNTANIIELLHFSNDRNILLRYQKILASAGIAKAYGCYHEMFDGFNYQNYVQQLAYLVSLYHPYAIFFCTSRLNKIISAQLQTELEIGLTADCMDLKVNEEGELIQVRPIFDGKK